MPCRIFSILSVKNFTVVRSKINGTLYYTELEIFHYYTKYNIVTLHYLRYCLKVKVQKKKRAVSCPTAQKEKSITLQNCNSS